MKFCKFAGVTPEEIYNEWLSIKSYEEERLFRRKWTNLVKAWKTTFEGEDLTPSSINNRIIAVKSFFKHLGMQLDVKIPSVRYFPYHNRDITTEELLRILNIASPRDKAFFAMMAQSGLRPHTLCRLKYKDLKEDFEKNRIPCLIKVRPEIAKGKYRGYFTFIGEDAVNYLKEYFRIRGKPKDDEYIFRVEKVRKREHLNVTTISFKFNYYAKKLGLISEEESKKRFDKPKTLRLYCLRKWFRNRCFEVPEKIVQFWMGHVLAHQDEHYLTKDVEVHRKIYKEKALPFLRLKPRIVDEQQIKVLAEELKKTKAELNEYKQLFGNLTPVQLLQKLGQNNIATAILSRASRDEIDRLYQALRDLQTELNLRKIQELVTFVMAKAPTDRELKEFMKRRRIGEQLMDEYREYLQCLVKIDDRWYYDKELDVLHLGDWLFDILSLKKMKKYGNR